MVMRVRIKDTGCSYDFFEVDLLLDGKVIASDYKQNPVACARWTKKLERQYRKAARLVGEQSPEGVV